MHALCRIRKYLAVEKAKLQINNADLDVCYESSIAKIYKIDFQTFQIIYNNYDRSYHDLLNSGNDISIHQRHLRYLATCHLFMYLRKM